MHNPALLILLLIPLVGSLGVFAMKDEQARLAKLISITISIGVAVYAVVLLFTFNTAMPTSVGDRYQWAFDVQWIKALGVHIGFGADGIAIVLVAMATILVPTVMLASWNAFDSKAGAEEPEPVRRPAARPPGGAASRTTSRCCCCSSSS